MQEALYLMKGFGIVIVLIIVLFICVILIARLFNRNKIKIKTKNGVQENLYVEIGEIKQYLQIRGNDQNNPIILFLHGGPGNPHAFIAPYYQRKLEKDYTFVNWDQRGCGRTFFENSDMNFEKDLSTDILINDVDEIVSYLSDRFGQNKIILMGHSWGTVLGVQYCLKHPEKVLSYIGVAQCINIMKGEELAVKTATDRAQSDGKIKYIKGLQNIWNKITPQKHFYEEFMRDFIKMRKLTGQYLTCKQSMSPLKTMWLGLISSEMSIRDIRFFLSISNLKKYCKYDVSLKEYFFFKFDLNEYSNNYEVPVYFISGDNDWVTPYSMVEEYFHSIAALGKEMVLIENAGHAPYLDNPKEFCDAVITLLENNQSYITK